MYGESIDVPIPLIIHRSKISLFVYFFFAAKSIDMETKMEKVCSTVIPAPSDVGTFDYNGKGRLHPNSRNLNYPTNRSAPFGKVSLAWWVLYQILTSLEH